MVQLSQLCLTAVLVCHKGALDEEASSCCRRRGVNGRRRDPMRARIRSRGTAVESDAAHVATVSGGAVATASGAVSTERLEVRTASMHVSGLRNVSSDLRNVRSEKCQI